MTERKQGQRGPDKSPRKRGPNKNPRPDETKAKNFFVCLYPHEKQIIEESYGSIRLLVKKMIEKGCPSLDSF